MVNIKVEYDIPADGAAYEIRTKFFKIAQEQGINFTITNFNYLLQKIAQEAFDEGRKFQRENPTL